MEHVLVIALSLLVCALVPAFAQCGTPGTSQCVGVNQTCGANSTFSLVCTPGLQCLPLSGSATFTATCLTQPTLGQSCNSSGLGALTFPGCYEPTHTYDITCLNQTCSYVTSGANDTCGGANQNCASGLTCTGGFCGPAIPAGGVCAYSNGSSCAGSLYCNGSFVATGICQARLGVNSTCAASTPYYCQYGLQCTSLGGAGATPPKTCQPAYAALNGSGCDTAVDCAVGLGCATKLKVCLLPPDVGNTCNFTGAPGTQCTPGVTSCTCNNTCVAGVNQQPTINAYNAYWSCINSTGCTPQAQGANPTIYYDFLDSTVTEPIPFSKGSCADLNCQAAAYTYLGRPSPVACGPTPAPTTTLPPTTTPAPSTATPTPTPAATTGSPTTGSAAPTTGSAAPTTGSAAPTTGSPTTTGSPVTTVATVTVATIGGGRTTGTPPSPFPSPPPTVSGGPFACLSCPFTSNNCSVHCVSIGGNCAYPQNSDVTQVYECQNNAVCSSGTCLATPTIGGSNCGGSGNGQNLGCFDSVYWESIACDTGKSSSGTCTYANVFGPGETASGPGPYLSANGGCTSGFSVGTGGTCQPATNGTNTCAPGSCPVPTVCDVAGSSPTTKCVSAKPSGSACLSDIECVSSTRCTSLGGKAPTTGNTKQICQTWYAGGAGAGCDDSADCGSNLFCSGVTNGVCTAPANTGSSCSVSTQSCNSFSLECVCGGDSATNSGNCQQAFTSFYGVGEYAVNSDTSTLPNFASCIVAHSCGRPEIGLAFGAGGCWDKNCQSQAEAFFGTINGGSCASSGATAVALSVLLVLAIASLLLML